MNSTISSRYGIPQVLTTTCTARDVSCDGSRVAAISCPFLTTWNYENIWTSSWYSSYSPYHIRPSGTYAISMPANHSSTSVDIALQRPALSKLDIRIGILIQKNR